MWESSKKSKRKSIYLSTGAVIEFIEKKIKDKKYQPRSLYSLPLWGMKYKNNQERNIKKFYTIDVVEDHLNDGGFQSWLKECIYISKLCSKSLNKKVISQVGSKDYLMNFLK